MQILGDVYYKDVELRLKRCEMMATKFRRQSARLRQTARHRMNHKNCKRRNAKTNNHKRGEWARSRWWRWDDIVGIVWKTCQRKKLEPKRKVFFLEQSRNLDLILMTRKYHSFPIDIIIIISSRENATTSWVLELQIKLRIPNGIPLLLSSSHKWHTVGRTRALWRPSAFSSFHFI